MKTLILSDIHVDTWYTAAVQRFRLAVDEVDESIVNTAMDFIWKIKNIPIVDCLLLAGDYANDFTTFKHEINWLANRYSTIYLVLGNHDLIVRGATDYPKSNLQFASSEQKIEAIRNVCNQYSNVHLLEGDVINDIGGCMGMCDFLCEPPQFGLDKFTYWQRKWFDGKHWKFFHQQPQAIVEHYDKLLTSIVTKQPKIVITHFTPYESGVPVEYRTSQLNYVFYFNAIKYFELLDHDTFWICGHTHNRRICKYVNSKGKLIQILCNPVGYPNEDIQYCDVVDYSMTKLERYTKESSMNDFLIEIE